MRRIIYFLLHLTAIVQVSFYMVSSQICATFERKLTMDNYTCEGSSYLFVENGSCRSIVDCTGTCLKSDICHGIFYNQMSQTCLGCNDMIRQGLVNTDIVPAAGTTKFYLRVRATTHGQSCTSSASCAIDQYCPGTGVCTCNPGYSYSAHTDNCTSATTHGQSCTSSASCAIDQYCPGTGVCTCNPGYSYSAHTDNCTFVCLTYGNTYEEHPQKQIEGFNTLTVVSSLSQCIDQCNADPDCRTFDFRVSKSKCMIQSETALTQPSAFNDDNADHYHRNCA